MSEREIPFATISTRRGLFLGLKTRATIGALAIATGFISDTNKPEFVINSPDIMPLYGDHNVGYSDYDASYKLDVEVQKTGQLPDIHIWPSDTQAQLKNLHPNILASDGVSYTPLTKNGLSVDTQFWYLLPGNPFEIKSDGERLFIIAADIPFEVLVAHKNGYTYLEPLQSKDPEQDVALNGITNHYEQILGDKIDSDTNFPVNDKDIDLFFKKVTYETLISNFVIGVGSLLYLASKPTLFKKKVSRRQFAKVSAFAALGFSNALRLFGWTITQDPTSNYDYSYAPISSIPEIVEHVRGILPYTEFRNALIAAKLDATEKEIQGGRSSVKVAVMGSFHQYGQPVWNNEVVRNGVISDILRQTFRLMENQNLQGLDRNKIVRYVSDFFGGVAIFEVGNKPDDLSQDKVAKSIPQIKTFISPTITRLTREAAVESGFIS